MRGATVTTSNAAIDILSGLKLEDGRRWGEAATSWQWSDAEAILERRRRRFYLTRPRGASKTSDLAGISIAALVDQLPAMSRSYVVAVDRDQGKLFRDAVLGFQSRDDTEDLQRALAVDSWVITNTANGATIEILAADAAGSWGKRPHMLIVDEFAQWPETPTHQTLWRALYSAMGKVRDSRLVILTTAGEPSGHAHRLIERARESREWLVNEVPGPCPWISEVDLAEDRYELPEWEFERLHMNRWTASDDRLVRADDLARCVTHDGVLVPRVGTSYVITVDIGLVHDRTAVAVCHAEARGRPLPHISERDQIESWGRTGHTIRNQAAGEVAVVLDDLEVWSGTRDKRVSLDAVEQWILGASRSYNRAPVFYDPLQFESLAERLSVRGVRTQRVTFSVQENSSRAVLLHRLIKDGLMSLPDDAELLDELAHVKLVESSPGVYRIDHDRNRHDDRAVALAMAAQILNGGASVGRSTSPRMPDRRGRGRR